MQSKKSLYAVVVAAAMLVGTSAFAESRHQGGTNRSSGGRIDRGGDRGGGRGGRVETRDSSRRFESRDNSRRFESRNDTRRFEPRNDTRRSDSRNDTRRFESRNDTRRLESRNDTRRFDSREWRSDSRVSPSRGQRYSGNGRVDRFVRERNGYRVWIGGGLYPIFVPFAHWRIHPLRVGLFIRFGGYWDPLGYWSIYDYSPYDGYYRYDNAYTSGVIRGVVESVDYRRGTLEINDDISRQFVTVTMPRDRRMDDVRPGDYVEFSGDWTRGGVFNAYRLDRVDEGRY